MVPWQEGISDEVRSVCGRPATFWIHGYAVSSLGSGIKLSAVVHRDDRALALGAVLAGTVGKFWHVLPIQGANKSEIAGGYHVGDEEQQEHP